MSSHNALTLLTARCQLSSLYTSVKKVYKDLQLVAALIYKSTTMENVYVHYYTVQSGAGIKEIGPVYHNLRFVQQGSGFGGFFGGLYRFLKPMINSGLNVLQKQAVKTGSSILSELGSRPLNDILLDQSRIAAEELKSKFKNKFQSGSGLMFTGAAIKRHKLQSKRIKAGSNKKPKQSRTKRRTKKTSANKTLKKINPNNIRTLDIFSK